MKKIVALCIFACAFVAVSAFAQATKPKVVVIPMGSSNVPGNLKTISVSSLVGVPATSSMSSEVVATCGHRGRHTTNTSDYLEIPIQLPDGATVSSVTFRNCDNDSSYNGVFRMMRSDGVQMAYGNWNTPDSLTPKEYTDTTIASPVIDNSLYSYVIEMYTSVTPGVNLYPIDATVTLTP